LNSHRADRSSRCNHAELCHAPKNTSDPVFLSPLLPRSPRPAPALTRYHLPPLFSPFLPHRTNHAYLLYHLDLSLSHLLPLVSSLFYGLVILVEESDYSKLSIGRIYRLDPIAMLRETCRCLSRIGYYRRFYRVEQNCQFCS